MLHRQYEASGNLIVPKKEGKPKSKTSILTRLSMISANQAGLVMNAVRNSGSDDSGHFSGLFQLLQILTLDRFPVSNDGSHMTIRPTEIAVHSRGFDSPGCPFETVRSSSMNSQPILPFPNPTFTWIYSVCCHLQRRDRFSWTDRHNFEGPAIMPEMYWRFRRHRFEYRRFVVDHIAKKESRSEYFEEKLIHDVKAFSACISTLPLSGPNKLVIQTTRGLVGHASVLTKPFVPFGTWESNANRSKRCFWLSSVKNCMIFAHQKPRNLCGTRCFGCANLWKSVQYDWNCHAFRLKSAEQNSDQLPRCVPNMEITAVRSLGRDWKEAQSGFSPKNQKSGAELGANLWKYPERWNRITEN